MILLIDNYDSFTFNVKHYLLELGQKVKVVRNDKITVEKLSKLNPKAIVISPGPCTPNEAGICLNAVTLLYKKFPILGICLGHQTIGQAFGGNIIKDFSFAMIWGIVIGTYSSILVATPLLLFLKLNRKEKNEE